MRPLPRGGFGQLRNEDPALNVLGTGDQVSLLIVSYVRKDGCSALIGDRSRVTVLKLVDDGLRLISFSRVSFCEFVENLESELRNKESGEGSSSSQRRRGIVISHSSSSLISENSVRSSSAGRKKSFWIRRTTE